MIFTKDLTNAPLLESLLLLAYPEDTVDLHNDFECISLSFEKNIFKLVFSGNDNSVIEILMQDYYIQKIEAKFNFTGSIILDNLYRGRLFEKSTLQDSDESGRHCFYFHFIEDVYLEISAKKVIANFSKELLLPSATTMQNEH